MSYKIYLDHTVLKKWIDKESDLADKLFLLGKNKVFEIYSNDYEVIKVIEYIKDNFVDKKEREGALSDLEDVVKNIIGISDFDKNDSLLEYVKSNNFEWLITYNPDLIALDESDVQIVTPEKFLSVFPKNFYRTSKTAYRSLIKLIKKPVNISLINQKGGVGKTTIAFNIGVCLAELGAKVLLIDMDPSANLTVLAGVTLEKGQPHITQLLSEEATLKDVIYPTTVKNLFIIPSTITLHDCEVGLLTSGISTERQLKYIFERDNIIKNFDFTITDNRPDLGKLVINSLAISDLTLVPLQLHSFAVQGLQSLRKLLNELADKEINKYARNWYLLPSLVQRNRREQNAIMEEVKNLYGDRLLEDEIYHNSKIFESTSKQTPLIYYPGSKVPSEVFRKLAYQLLEEFSVQNN